MKKILCTLTIALWITGNFTVTAQVITGDTTLEKQEQLFDLQKEKEAVVQHEKNKLRVTVEEITARLDNKEISKEEAEQLKVQAAEKHALNIENKVAIIENRFDLLERNGSEDKKFHLDFNLGDDSDSDNENVRGYHKRTHSSLLFAIGLNNTIIEGQSLDDSPYKIGGSRFLELGNVWTTRVFEDSNWLRLKYGFSFQFNGLKLDDNKYLVDNGDGTTGLQEFSEPLKKAKFRMDNLVIPLHFEFGPSKFEESDGKKYFSSANTFKIGLGGYAGVNLSTIQKLKYEKDGSEIKEKFSGSYNTNNFIYGLSGYIGWDNTSLYVKYDLNPIFKTGAKQRNISAGLRFEL